MGGWFEGEKSYFEIRRRTFSPKKLRVAQILDKQPFFLSSDFYFSTFFMFRRKKIPAVISGTNHHLRNLDLDFFRQTLRPWLLFG